VPLTPLPPKSPASVLPPATPGLSGLTTLAVGVVVVAALYFGREVFIPLVLAILFSLALAPVVSLFRRLYFPRVAAVMSTVVLALGLLVGVGFVIGEQVTELAGNLPQYQTVIEKKVAGLQDGFLGRASDLLKRATREVQKASDQTSEPPPATSGTPAQTEGEKPTLVRVQEPNPSPFTIARNVLGPVVEPLTTTGIVLVVVVFILLQREDLRDRLIRLFGASDLHRTTAAMNDATRRLSTYFLTQLGINAAFGVIVALGLWWIGVPSPALWGVFGALMRFVPYVGGFISAAAPLLLAAAVDPGWSMVFWTVALFLITEALMGQVAEPMLYGHSTGMSPLAVVVAALFWGFLWGPIGLILATPFTVCLVVLGRHVERLEFLDVLLGDRPALTPVENFYQRMLAGDPDEAQDQAEQMLKTRSLSSYYDEVALKGLQLAAADFQRGVLTQPQLDTIKTLTQSLVDEFEERPDEEPAATDKAAKTPGDTPSLAEQAHPTGEQVAEQAPEVSARPAMWQGEAPVLCIAGRGMLDEAAASMLAQLLIKHGIGARVVPHSAVARGQIGKLDVDGVAMVCVSYLDISGSPAHLRYLLRRLRDKIPNGKVLVGLWPTEDAVLTDQTVRKEVGADYYVTSLREAVASCLAAVRAAAAQETTLT
jgi:predicted PurR-regulated permease PerM